jgi:hypothetical protein
MRQIARPPVVSSPHFTRGELFGAVYMLACANGLAAKMIFSVHKDGWMDAAVGTFGISAIVILACVAGISVVWPDKSPTNLADLTVALVLSGMIALPVGAINWVAITILSLYVIRNSPLQRNSPLHRGALILLAATVPMLWSRLVFDLFANFILSVDAALVGEILGTPRSGNMVQFADHSGTLVIFSSCSSLANVSLALLCWVTISQALGHRRRAQDLFWCLLACCSVVAINVLRISIMGLSSAHYEALHSQAGEFFLNVIIVVLVVSICIVGTRRDAFDRA